MDWSAPDARAERFARLQRFDGLSKKDIKAVIKAGKAIRVQPGHDLLRQGEPGTGVHIIVAGELSVHQDGAPVGRMRAGDLVGEISLLTRTAATATLTATSECETLLIEYDDVRRLIDAMPTFRKAIRATAHDRLERDRHRE